MLPSARHSSISFRTEAEVESVAEEEDFYLYQVPMPDHCVGFLYIAPSDPTNYASITQLDMYKIHARQFRSSSFLTWNTMCLGDGLFLCSLDCFMVSHGSSRP